jgi:hypothetical protein
MVFFNVKVQSATGASNKSGKLYISSGIIEFEDGEFSSIDHEKRAGGKVFEIKEEKKPAPKLPAPPAASVEQSKPEKKKKKQEN